MHPDVEIRTATTDDRPELRELISGAFLSDPDEEFGELLPLIEELDRTHVAVDNGRLVGTGASQTRELTVPGAVRPAAHITAVAVAATHRRRGILTRVMAAQLDDARKRGEPIAVLWASEAPIYGRFGFGLAAWHVEYKIATKDVVVPNAPTPGSFTQVKPSDAMADLAAVHDRARSYRPGWSSRPGDWWKFLLSDAKTWRDGRSKLRGVLHRASATSDVDGYALWRVKLKWGETGPDGSVSVVEVVAANVGAYADLWRFLLSIDLARTATYVFAAPDEPLPHVVEDADAIVQSPGPGLWVRIVDVPAALACRRYATPVNAVIGVADDMFASNTRRWRLMGDSASATCEATDDEPDIELGICELGAAYLGGTSLQTLADAGRVAEHTPGSLARVSAAFGWYRAPSAVEIF